MRFASIAALTLMILPVVAPVANAQEPRIVAGGSTPFWQAEVVNGRLNLVRPGAVPLRLPVIGTEPGPAGETVIHAADRAAMIEASLSLTSALCHDRLTGMPHPQSASLEIGDAVLSGCAGEPLDLLEDSAWIVDHLEGADLVEDARPTLLFDAEGGLAGLASCNRYFTDFALTGEGLTTSPQIGTTRMACETVLMDQEVQFLEALGDITRFDIDETGALILFGGDEMLMTASRSAG